MTDRQTGSPTARPGRRRERLDAMLGRVRRVEARREGRQRHRNGEAAGALLLAVWVSAVLSSLFGDAVPDPRAYSIPAAGICTGLVCLTIPWERTSPGWLHVAIAVATAEIAAWVALTDLSYGVYYVLLAAYAGYVSRWRGEVVGHAALIGVALLAPLAYHSQPGAVAGNALLIMSVVAVISAMAAWVRGQVTARQRLYRQFALEALRLAVRIRGDALPPQPLEILPDDGLEAEDGFGEDGRFGAEDRSPAEASERLATELEALIAPRAPAAVHRSPHGFRAGRAVAIAGVIAAGLPLAAAGLASAGVTMPKLARAPFDALNIDLPNQGSVATSRHSSPSPSVRDRDRSRQLPQSSRRRFASSAPRGHAATPDRSRATPSAGRAAPDSTARRAPGEGVSLAGVTPSRSAPRPEPGEGPQPPVDLGPTVMGLAPDRDAASADPVGAGAVDGAGIDARVEHRRFRR